MAHNQKGAGAPLLAVSAGLAILAYSLGLRAEKGYMILVAKDTQEHPIQGVQLGVEGIGSIRLTGSDGKVRIRLGSAAEEGDSVSLILQSSPKGKDYVILSPWNRRLRIPKFDEKPDNFVEVILVERGDRAMLESGKALRSITLQINSTNAKDLTSEQTAQPDPRTALNIVAKQYGLAPEDVDKAVKWWASTSTDEFDRGLAAYYARRFQEAGDEFRSSLKEI